ncbi:SCP-like protein [Ancylostoma duodenale]|uniref:SCP-like protein n=1 Tax=Ancylostoma duodenale TaxID=51022 RepID=A0A0C2FVS6_9BILA|nr:SCP-like protein [Ancylostoma duodenale]
MSKKSRQVVLDEHNDYRSRAAKGEFRIANEDSKLKVLPPATRMPMLKYNCTLENRSLKWAYTVQCAMKHSGPGENIFAIGGHYSAEQVAETAVKAWTDEISQHGLSGLDQWARNVGHATQICSICGIRVMKPVLTCIKPISLCSLEYIRNLAKQSDSVTTQTGRN